MLLKDSNLSMFNGVWSPIHWIPYQNIYTLFLPRKNGCTRLPADSCCPSFLHTIPLLRKTPFLTGHSYLRFWKISTFNVSGTKKERTGYIIVIKLDPANLRTKLSSKPLQRQFIWPRVSVEQCSTELAKMWLIVKDR